MAPERIALPSGTPAAGDRPPAWKRHLGFLAYLGGVSVVVGVLTEPVAILAVPLVDAMFVGAYIYDEVKAGRAKRQGGPPAAPSS